MIIVTVNM